MKSAPFFSVIIPAYNRPESLLECLRSLERQTFPREGFETIIADDSEDGRLGRELEGRLARSPLTLRIIVTGHRGPGAARNAAASGSTGEVLAFTEDDMLLDERWLERASSRFHSGTVDCLEGRTLIHDTGQEVRFFEENPPLSFIPCNLFIRKQVFDSAGGYDTDFFEPVSDLYFREDADMGFRLLQAGHRCVRSEDVVAYHPELFRDVGSYFRHARRYFFDPLLYRKHPALYREMIEVKERSGLRVHRPFHYLSFMYCFQLFMTVLAVFAGSTSLAVFCAVSALLIGYPIRYRYERKTLPEFWNPVKTLAFLILPLYYFFWFLRGCRRYRSWGAML